MPGGGWAGIWQPLVHRDGIAPLPHRRSGAPHCLCRIKQSFITSLARAPLHHRRPRPPRRTTPHEPPLDALLRPSTPRPSLHSSRQLRAYYVVLLRHFSRLSLRCAPPVTRIHCNPILADKPTTMGVDRVLPERKNPLLEPTDSTAGTYPLRISSIRQRD